MLSYMEYLQLPAVITIVIAGVFLVLQIIGEIIEFKGKTAPEILKIRKYFARKKKERRALEYLPEILDSYGKTTETLASVKTLLSDINKHYSKDNIATRDRWMNDVNTHISNSEKRISEQDSIMRELNSKLDKNNDVTLSILIENKRNAIINFADKVIDESFPVTKEQFNRIFKMHKEYEEIIKENNLTNGEVDIANRIIEESYENHMKNHSFIEDIRGYNK